jgi:hypothetical protein
MALRGHFFGGVANPLPLHVPPSFLRTQESMLSLRGCAVWAVTTG